MDHILSSSKNSKKNLDSYFVTSFWLFILENFVNVPSKSNNQKNFFYISFLLRSWRSMTKIAGSRSASASGYISWCHGSADPDPHQNVMDPEHCTSIFIPDAVQINESQYNWELNKKTSFLQESIQGPVLWIRIGFNADLDPTIISMRIRIRGVKLVQIRISFLARWKS